MPLRRKRVCVTATTTIKGYQHRSGIVPMEAVDPEDFTLSVRLPRQIDVCVLVGVLPTYAEDKRPDEIFGDARPPEEGILKHGFFVDLKTGTLFGQDGTNNEKSGLLQRGLEVGLRLRLRYRGGEEPALYASLGGDEFKSLPFRTKIPFGEYRPCVLLDEKSYVEVEMSQQRRVRRRSSITPPKTPPTGGDLAKMWEDRTFTDASIVCDGVTFPVHRAVLMSASPVFDVAFRSSFLEGVNGKMQIEDASAEVVETMLKFVYTGAMDQDMAAAVLPLAHRFELRPLVIRCGDDLVENISPKTVSRVVRALRNYSEDLDIQPLWMQVQRECQADADMVQALMKGL